MATLVNNSTFSLVGAREMLTSETTTKYFSSVTKPEDINKIVLSTKSFDIDSAKVAASFIEKMSNLKIADLSDFIAGRETSIGLEVLNIISIALSKTKLVEFSWNPNNLRPFQAVFSKSEFSGYANTNNNYRVSGCRGLC